LLVVFDAFERWIRWFSFEVCSFIKILPDDGERRHRVRSTAAPHRKTISAFPSQSAEDVEVRDAGRIVMERP
jgi:hypothetical protein